MPTLLYVASRWPYPVRSGRARMIAQTLEMASATHDVVLAAFAPAAEVAGQRPAHVAEAVALRRPGMAGSIASVAARPLSPLQSHLFRSGSAEADLGALAARVRPDVAMLDMIRLAGYGPALRRAAPGLRLVLDMDDLLSRRYAQMNSGTGDILGAFAAGMPGPVRRLAGALPGALLATEGRLVARAEARALREHDAVVLVSPREAEALGSRGGATVFAVPPAVEPAEPRARDFSRGLRFVFLGDEAYAPNAEALRLFQVFAAGLARAGRPVSFQSAGRKAEGIATPDVERLGFVDDLDAFLGPDAVMVAPIVTGTGIKTKLLDALARGVPVVTTPRGAEGLALDHGRDFLVSDVAGIPALLRDIAAGSMDADLSAMGLAGAARVHKDHAPGRVAENLARALGARPPVEDWAPGRSGVSPANDPFSPAAAAEAAL